MKLSILVLLLFIFGIISPVMAQDKDAAIKLFKEYSCNGCHSIKKFGVAVEERDVGEKTDDGRIPPDLSDIGTKHDAEWISRFLQKKEEIKGKTHKRMFKGSKDERETVAGWLASLK